MKTIRSGDGVEGAHQRRPARAIRVHAPKAPRDLAAQPLGLERAEHDSSVRQHHRMQSARDIEMANFLDVTAKPFIRVVHDKELQGNGGVTFRGTKTIAITG